jgi:hypothetical protein
VFSFAKKMAPFSQHMLNHRAPRKDEGTFFSVCGGHKDTTISHFTFLSLNQKPFLFSHVANLIEQCKSFHVANLP